MTVALHLQDQAKALRSLDTSLSAYQFTHCNVLEDLSIKGKVCFVHSTIFFFDRVTGWTKVQKV